MVSALDSGANSPGSSPGPGHCVVFLGKTLYSDLLRRRANARNISFRISLQWLTYIVNSVDKTKLSYATSGLIVIVIEQRNSPGFLSFFSPK